jgi:hypothetical protein
MENGDMHQMLQGKSLVSLCLPWAAVRQASDTDWYITLSHRKDTWRNDFSAREQQGCYQHD